MTKGTKGKVWKAFLLSGGLGLCSPVLEATWTGGAGVSYRFQAQVVADHRGFDHRHAVGAVHWRGPLRGTHGLAHTDLRCAPRPRLRRGRVVFRVVRVPVRVSVRHGGHRGYSNSYGLGYGPGHRGNGSGIRDHIRGYAYRPRGRCRPY